MLYLLLTFSAGGYVFTLLLGKYIIDKLTTGIAKIYEKIDSTAEKATIALALIRNNDLHDLSSRINSLETGQKISENRLDRLEE